MKKIYIRVITFLVVLAGLIGVASFLVVPKEVGSYNIVDVERILNEVKKEKEDSLDVIFIGDSLVYAAYSPVQMYGEQGFTSYNCSTATQRLCDSYSILTDVFKTQTPSVVVLEAHSIFFPDADVYDEPEWALTKGGELFPYLHYHNFYKLLPSPLELLHKATGKNTTNDNKGFNGKNGVREYIASIDGNLNTSTDMPQAGLDYFIKINQLCEENNCELLVVGTPSVVNWNPTRTKLVTEFMEENQLNYFDMNDLTEEIGIDWSKDTVDGGDHLNVSGAEKLSTYFGNYLVEKYELADHRSEQEYSDWNDLYQKQLKKKKEAK